MTAAAWATLLVLIAPAGDQHAAARHLHGQGLRRQEGAGRPRVPARSSALIYRLTGVDPESEQRWQTYAISLLAFSFASVLVLYAQLRLQGHLPFNPDGLRRREAHVVVQHRR